MSLQLAAQHLQAHGRGNDSHLVHMTSGELEALQKMAQQHGGSLTVNPHTGLPEAGFLSSILPTVAGIGLGIATGDPFLAAAIVGGADYAITGSLGQGLMAGLGAWSGAGLAGDISKAATTTAVSDASQVGNAVSAATNATIPTNIGMAGAGNMADTTLGGIVGSGQALGQQAAQAGMTSGEFLAANPGLAQTATAAGTAAAPATTILGGQANPTGWDAFKSGFGNVTQDLQHAKDFAMANKMDVLGTAMPIIGGIAKEMQPGVPDNSQQYNNPAGFKRLSSDFKGTFPTPPAHPYQAQYRDYAANPYHPSNFTVAADGGLMEVNHMKSGGYSGTDIYDAFNAQNVANAKQSKAMYDAIAENAKAENARPFDPGYEKDYEGMNPYQRANAMVANMHKHAFMPGKTHTQEMSGLGSIATDPSMVAQAQIAQQAQQPTDAKEGGLMNYAPGGFISSILKPTSPGSNGYLVNNSGNYKVAPPAPTPQVNNFGIPQARNLSELGNMLGALPRDSSPTGNMSYPNGGSGWGYNLAMQQLPKNLPAPAPVYNAQNLSPNFAAFNPVQPNTTSPNMNGHIYIPHYNHGGGVEYNMGGLGSLGSYSDGGRLLRGPGDGVSDSIPASIGHKQPARLAEGEFVIPARIVSELGNGSTDAGAKRLYAMMDRIKAKRAKTKNIAADTKAYKYLPA